MVHLVQRCEAGGDVHHLVLVDMSSVPGLSQEEDHVQYHDQDFLVVSRAVCAKGTKKEDNDEFKSSLVAKYVTELILKKKHGVTTKTCGFTLNDWDSSNDFADMSDPLIHEYHGLSPKAIHTSHMVMVKTKIIGR